MTASATDAASLALAHADHAPAAREWLGWWTWDPLVAAALVVAAALYATGTRRMWRIAGAGHGVRWPHAAAYGAGLVVLALTLLSPLDRVSDVLFSAHMAQHELLMLVAAPLVVLGKPLVPAIWALPRRWRVRVGRAVQRPAVVRTWRFLTAPFVAVALHAVARWAWHAPAAYDAALADDGVHVVQHLTFFATAALFWWSLIHGRYGRIGYGVAVAFVFFTALHSGLLAALLSLSGTPWYEVHAARTAAWGVDAIEDQQRAGLIMWVPAGALMTGIGLALLAAWLGEAERRMKLSRHPGLGGER